MARDVTGCCSCFAQAFLWTTSLGSCPANKGRPCALYPQMSAAEAEDYSSEGSAVLRLHRQQVAARSVLSIATAVSAVLAEARYTQHRSNCSAQTSARLRIGWDDRNQIKYLLEMCKQMLSRSPSSITFVVCHGYLDLRVK